MRSLGGEACARLKRDLGAFRFLENEDLDLLTPYFHCRRVEAGETLWHEGDSCDYLAFLIEGRVDEKKQTEFKGKEVIVGVFGPGTLIGEVCVLDGKPRASTAMALEETALLALSREDLDELLDRHPDLGIRLLKGLLLTVSNRLRKSLDRLAAIF